MDTKNLLYFIQDAGYKITKLPLKLDSGKKWIAAYYVNEDDVIASTAKIIGSPSSWDEREALLKVFKFAKMQHQPRNRKVVYFPEMEIV